MSNVRLATAMPRLHRSVPNRVAVCVTVILRSWAQDNVQRAQWEAEALGDKLAVALELPAFLRERNDSAMAALHMQLRRAETDLTVAKSRPWRMVASYCGKVEIGVA